MVHAYLFCLEHRLKVKSLHIFIIIIHVDVYVNDYIGVVGL